MATGVLSQVRNDFPICAAITTVTLGWIQDVLEGIEGDEFITQLMTKGKNIDAVPLYSDSGQFMRHKNWVMVRQYQGVRDKLLQLIDSSLYDVHSGVHDTHLSLNLVFFWLKTKHDVLRLLQPFPNRDPATSRKVTNLCLGTIYKLHRLPLSNVIHREEIFTSHLCGEIPEYDITEGKCATWVETGFMRGHNKLKLYSIQSKTHKVFEVEDQVYRELQPHRCNSIDTFQSMNSSFCYYSPYTVLQKIERVAYNLDLPQGLKIHPVFNVSLLKKRFMEGMIPISQPPELMSERFFHISPTTFLDRRTVHHATVQAYFTLHKPVSDLALQIVRLRYDLNGEIHVPPSMVVILFIHQDDLFLQQCKSTLD